MMHACVAVISPMSESFARSMFAPEVAKGAGTGVLPPDEAAAARYRRVIARIEPFA